MLGIVDHIGIAVEDLDRSIAFHVNVLGMRIVADEVNPTHGVREVMLAPHSAAADAADGTGTTLLQLLAPMDATGTVHRFLQTRGPGLHHVAYRVDDLAEATALLSRRGVTAVYDEAMSGARDSRINFLHPRDAGGVLIELVQLAEPADGAHS